MHLQPQKLLKVIVLALISLALAPFCLAEDKTLQSDSPFLPPGYGKNQAPPKPPPTVRQGEIARNLQLRGIVYMRGAYSFSFFDKKTNKSFWIKESESNKEGYQVGNYDAKKRSIKVTKGGTTEEVTLISSTNKPVMVNTSVSVAKTPPPAKTPNVQPPANNQNKTARSIPRRRVILPKKN